METIKEIIIKVKELKLNFSKHTGAINDYVAFGSDSEEKLKIYNEAINNVLDVITKLKNKNEKRTED